MHLLVAHYKSISFYWVRIHSSLTEVIFLVRQLWFIVLHSAGGHAFDWSRVRICFALKNGSAIS